MLKKAGKIVFWIVLVTIYLNIGWGLGYYYHYNVAGQTFESASWHARLLGGHCAFFAKDEIAAEEIRKHNFLLEKIVISITWPCTFFVSIISWIFHFVFWICPSSGWPESSGLFS